MGKEEKVNVLGFEVNKTVVYLVVFLLGVYFAAPIKAYLSGLGVAQVNVAQDLFQQEGDAGNAGANANAGGAAGAEVPEVVDYAPSTIRLYILDKLDPKSGVPNVTVDVYNAPEEPYTQEDLSAIATDPNARVLDEGVSDANGEVVFTKTVIKVGKPYLYAIKGDSNVYDKLSVKTIPVPAKYFKVDVYTFEEPEYVYKVGAFADPSPDADNILTGAEYPELDATNKSGPQYFEFDITISETEPGAIIKDPVLVIRTPETTDLASGAIKSIYIVKKTGTDLGLPIYNLVGNINSRPIPIKVAYDKDLNANVMTVADSATYTVKLTYDADLIKNGDEIEFVLDDLGDYRGKDIATLDTKASPAKVVVQFKK